MVKYAGAGGVGAAVCRLLDKFAILTLNPACINVCDLIVIPLQFWAMKHQTARINVRYRIYSHGIKWKNLCAKKEIYKPEGYIKLDRQVREMQYARLMLDTFTFLNY